MFRFPPVLALLFVLSVIPGSFCLANGPRTERFLTDNWRTTYDETDSKKYIGFEQPTFSDSNWSLVDVPHNWDSYQGYRQLRHGNLHGTAWYRRTFRVDANERGRRIFLFFEGVGSYATVWVNGKQVGQHAGGLTTFTLDITDAVVFDRDNLLAVRADHPAGIRDLPWVCGGCERATGFSEGPQPFGIFRPVRLVTTAPVCIEPFGVHAWIDGPQSSSVTTCVTTDVKNYCNTPSPLTLVTRLLDHTGKPVVETRAETSFASGASATVSQKLPAVTNPRLWSPADPYLYTVVSEIIINRQIVDRLETPFGFRWVEWPKTTNSDRRRFLLNGQPFFLNGTADYEHQLGNNYAFSDQQIDARVHQIEAAGFNAFRDAHHPHNLRFQQHWDHDGLLWWTQFGAHIWFDNDAFRTNFKTLLTEWVKERRNSPSLILWGLQNESQLPTAFAKECSALIRELDPTASTQRLITTCNGGTGTDWDVPQNWSGTYSGDPAFYDDDLRAQSLVGEYGAWRSLGQHYDTAAKIFRKQSALPAEKTSYDEEMHCFLLALKIRLAENARNDSCGHFHWPFTSHANPGRNFGERGEQLYDGIRPLDRVGPVNNKGLFTIWGEPTDAFYLYRASFAPKATQPMVYIVSHTWPDRWTAPGNKYGIIVYSNCDEVELFNGSRSLGRRTQAGRGTHFQWDNVEIDCNSLRAIAIVAGKIAATDEILLEHLPQLPGLKNIEPDLTAPAHDQHYLYRVNCGGPAYTDRHGNTWLADRDFVPGDSWGASSWADDFENLPAAFASQRKIHTPIRAVYEEPLFQTFRYGREKLAYRFNVPDGEYQIDLFFTEPWYGVGGSLVCTGWRVFDIALNGTTVLRDFDLWREAGYATGCKKTFTAKSANGLLKISFPRVESGQAIIAAIAISSKAKQPAPNLPPPTIVLVKAPAGSSVETHLDTGDHHYSDRDAAFTQLPAELLEADWIKTPSTHGAALEFKLNIDADLWIAIADSAAPKPAWLSNWERTSLTLSSNATPGILLALYRKPFDKNSTVLITTDGTVFASRRLPPTPPQFVTLDPKSTDWVALGNAKPGIRIAPLSQTITRFPENLTSGDFILPRARHKLTGNLVLTANDHVEIVGAFPPESAIKGNWIEAKQLAIASDSNAYTLRRQRIHAGSTASFTTAGDIPIFAFARAVRPSSTYALQILPEGRTEWIIQVGVGDRYGLNFNYRNITRNVIPATLEIVQADGSVLRTDPLEFAPSSSKSDWSVLRTRTGASINAGSYTLRLKVPSTDALQLNTLEVE